VANRIVACMKDFKRHDKKVAKQTRRETRAYGVDMVKALHVVLRVYERLSKARFSVKKRTRYHTALGGGGAAGKRKKGGNKKAKRAAGDNAKDVDGENDEEEEREEGDEDEGGGEGTDEDAGMLDGDDEVCTRLVTPLLGALLRLALNLPAPAAKDLSAPTTRPSVKLFCRSATLLSCARRHT
jgi:hypothetical protein